MNGMTYGLSHKKDLQIKWRNKTKNTHYVKDKNDNPKDKCITFGIYIYIYILPKR